MNELDITNLSDEQLDDIVGGAGTVTPDGCPAS